jgi:hypothetical protein
VLQELTPHFQRLRCSDGFGGDDLPAIG